MRGLFSGVPPATSSVVISAGGLQTGLGSETDFVLFMTQSCPQSWALMTQGLRTRQMWPLSWKYFSEFVILVMFWK